MSRHAIFVVNASRAEAVAATKEISQILLKVGFVIFVCFIQFTITSSNDKYVFFAIRRLVSRYQAVA
mgnify:CR=1 FL=1